MKLFGRAAERGRGWVSEMRGTFSAGGTPEMGPNITAGQMTIDGVPPHVRAIWSYYWTVPEFHADVNFLAACLSRCTLRLGVLDIDNRIGPAFDDKGKPLEGVPKSLSKLAARLIASLRSAPGTINTFGPVGGQSILLGNMGKNLAAPAECYLVATKTPTGDHWEVLSTVELQPVETLAGEKQRFKRRSRLNGQTVDFVPAFYLRIFRPHPVASGEADSSAVPLLLTLERLALLNAEGVADSKSRLKGPGVYWLPSEIDFPSTDEDPEGDQYMSRKFIDVANVGIRDPESASRHVPIVARGPAEALKAIRHDRFDYNDGALIDKRQAAVGDLARGVDLPYEATVGYSDSSFANAFAVDEQLTRIYVSPWLDLITGFLTAGWLTKALMVATDQPLDQPPSDDIRRLVVWYDVSDLVTSPDPTKLAMWAYGNETNPNFLTSSKGARRLTGIPEGEAPDDEEIEARLARAQMLRSRAEQGSNNPDANPDDPSPDETPDGERDTDEEVGKRVLSLANMAVSMAVQTVGSKLRAKCAKKPEYLRRIDGIDAADVARVLGPATVEVLGGTGPLFNGSFHAFGHTVMREFSDIGRVDAADLAAAAVKMVERASLARLGNPAAVIDTHAAADFLALLNQ